MQCFGYTGAFRITTEMLHTMKRQIYRTLILIFWYQKMIFWYQKMIFWYQKTNFWYRKLCEFLISENHFLISENQFLISENHFLISEINFWYQKMPRFPDIGNSKLFFDIRKCHEFLISKIIFWYQKRISDIGKSWHFLISEYNFWYQKLFSDIRKSKFPLVFAKINRYLILFVMTSIMICIQHLRHKFIIKKENSPKYRFWISAKLRIP